ncbi:adenylosuccinate synthetase [Candidatus Parcubacteria bacterium]|nr:adenylosuccinate synthetase [Candidatus Parcubacteria bacterium]
MNWLNESTRTLAVIGLHFGDEGKGKFVDKLTTDWADIVARGTGGANAGHTICIGDEKHVFHLIPSGILHPGKLNVIGNGVAVDPRVVVEELDILKSKNLATDHLRIAYNAHLVLPSHLVIDRLRESGSGKVGSTLRGVGPTYVDHYRRIGLQVRDLRNKDALWKKLKLNLEEHACFMRSFDREVIRDIMEHEHLLEGAYFRPNDLNVVFDSDAIVEQYLAYGRLLAQHIEDTDALMYQAVKSGQRILLEGAQGTLLSERYGTYPYVTASDCTTTGLAQGVGLSVRDVDQTLGIAKAFYMSRVGGGPFPTEMGGEKSERWCAKEGVTRDVELREYPSVSISKTNPIDSTTTEDFFMGVAIRRHGNEYGATTGRPRRVGWFDLPLLRHAAHVVGRDIALTMLDVLDACPEIKICTGYIYAGPDQWVGNRQLTDGHVISCAVPMADILEHCEPLYKVFPGWMSDITGIRSRKDLPRELLNIVSFIESEARVTTRVLSVGPDREQTIFDE